MFNDMIECTSYLLILGASPDARPVVLEQMLGTVLDAGGAVRVLPVCGLLPLVRGGVVSLHRGALLFAHAVVIEVLARLEREINMGLIKCKLKKMNS